MKTKLKFSLADRIKSFSYAINGFIQLLRLEHNARIHFVAMIATIVLGLCFEVQRTDWIALTIVMGMVFVTELIKSSVERLADVIEPKWDDRIGLVKDYCAAAVLISAIVALVVGCIVFIPHILSWV